VGDYLRADLARIPLRQPTSAVLVRAVGCHACIPTTER
jgi:hypothetical protein